MVPYPDARISDFGPDDRLHVQCVCQRVVIIPPRILTASETRKLWVTIRATLSQGYVGETEHERGSAGTVRGLC
jgi:hypothetical protein